MRDLRFRAWNKETKQMIDLNKITLVALSFAPSIAGARTGVYVPDDDRLEIMQFTGLKDCNGKEIYEGDIVSAFIYGGEKPTESVVTFSESGFGIEYEWSDGDGFYLAQFPGSLEVIGNIYEDA